VRLKSILDAKQSIADSLKVVQIKATTLTQLMNASHHAQFARAAHVMSVTIEKEGVRKKQQIVEEDESDRFHDVPADSYKDQVGHRSEYQVLIGQIERIAPFGRVHNFLVLTKQRSKFDNQFVALRDQLLCFSLIRAKVPGNKESV
jgi:hypothetical protein